MDIVEIVKIRTSPWNRQDFLAWFPERNDGFIGKSTYRLATAKHDEIFVGGVSS